MHVVSLLIYSDMLFFWGMRGGMFRSKRGFSENQDKTKLFIFHQLAVGVGICIDEFQFNIVDIDDKTLQFMIDNPKEVNIKKTNLDKL